MTHARPSLRRQSGFTIMELMIAVAIMGVLFGIALPSYKDYVRRGALPEGVSALSDYKIKMEQYYQDNRNYGSGAAGEACANASPAPDWSTFAPSGKKNFSYSCVLSGTSGQGYAITATGTTGTPAAGHVYIQTHRGQQTTQFKGTTVAKDCWLMRGDEC